MKNIKEFLLNCWKNIKNLSIFIWNKFLVISKNIFLFLKEITIESYNKSRNGDEELNNVLIYWSILPALVYLIVRAKFIKYGFFALSLDIVHFCLACLSFYFIIKAVNVHPEYDIERTETLQKIEYYNSLSDEEYNKIILEEKKDKRKNLFKRLFFIKGGKPKELFKIVKIFLIFIIILTFKRIFF